MYDLATKLISDGNRQIVFKGNHTPRTLLCELRRFLTLKAFLLLDEMSSRRNVLAPSFSTTFVLQNFDQLWIAFSGFEMGRLRQCGCSFSCLRTGNTKGGSITVPLTSCLTGLYWSVLQIKTKIVWSHTADSKPVKQEVNSTVILPSLVFPAPKVHLHVRLHRAFASFLVVNIAMQSRTVKTDM